MRRPLFLKSVAFRLTLWYAAVFTASAAAVFVSFYFLLAAVIRDRIDQDLSEQAAKMSTLAALQGMDAVKRVSVLEAQAAGEKKVFFRFLLRSGEAFSSSNMEYWRNIPVDREAVRRLVSGGRQVFETRRVRERRHPVRILYTWVAPSVILQIGQSMDPYGRITEAFVTMFVVTTGLLLLVAAGVGWFMARRALAGVAAVTRTARGISDLTLDQRVPVRGSGDEIDRLADTFNDMLARIQRLVAGIREMSDNIAHDLRSPITRIRGLAEVTLTTGASREDLAAMASSTIEECDRLLEMISTMLLISRTEAGVEDRERAPLDMAEMVHGVAELFRPAAEDGGISLRVDSPESCRATGDVRTLQRMAANLLDNALKYTPEGGWVKLMLRCAEGKSGPIRLEVSDSGIGIAADDLPHVFDRFYRCDESRSASGTGLGLSLARAVAEAHGGRIAVASEPGRGSTFTVTLPRG